MESYNITEYIVSKIVEITYGQAVNLVIIILMIKLIIVIFVVVIISLTKSIDNLIIVDTFPFYPNVNSTDLVDTAYTPVTRH